MDTNNHTVTIPIADYNQLIESEQKAKNEIADNAAQVEKLRVRGREFVSALAFLEEKGLLAEFNAKINKHYKLESVGINKGYKALVDE